VARNHRSLFFLFDHCIVCPSSICRFLITSLVSSNSSYICCTLSFKEHYSLYFKLKSKIGTTKLKWNCKTTGQTMSYKTLHRKIKIEQQEPHKKKGVNSVALERQAVSAPLVTPVVFVTSTYNSNFSCSTWNGHLVLLIKQYDKRLSILIGILLWNSYHFVDEPEILFLLNPT
jgi:hypothetical protein